ALHRAQHGHDLLRGLELTAGHRGLGGLFTACHVRRARAELLHRLARGERGDGGRAPRTRARDLLALARHHRILRTAAYGLRSTRDPGTMSSLPSAQRTQALVPPS